MITAAFFQSLGFAIPALVIVGLSWCITGFVMGNCPKHNIPSEAIQQTAALLSISISLILCVLLRQWLKAPWSVFGWASLAYAAGGAINFFMLQLMSKAMQRGPNGVIWAIIQSALIFPFMGGVVFFGQRASLLQWLGVLAIVGALFLFGLAKNNTVAYQPKAGELSWKILTFCAFGCVAVQQNLTTAPSYFPVTEGVPSILRTVATSAGALIGYLLLSLRQKRTPEEKANIRNCYRKAIFWKYIIAMQGFSLFTSYLLFFPGVDIMARNGLGGAAYPLMVGSCIISFTLLAVLQLKERLSALQITGLLLCIAGLAGICMK